MHLGDYIFEHAAQRVTPIPKHLYLTTLSLTRPETHYFQDPVVHQSLQGEFRKGRKLVWSTSDAVLSTSRTFLTQDVKPVIFENAPRDFQSFGGKETGSHSW